MRRRCRRVPIVRIARHGETTWNAAGRYQGRLDTPLSPLGHAQARALAGALRGKGVRRVISSPLSRCVQTAIPSAQAHGLAVHTDPLLVEIAHGTWEGRYREEIARSEPLLYRQWCEQPQDVRFSGGESLRDVYERWQRFVGSFEAHVDTLLMTHDVVVRIAILERTSRGLDELRHVGACNACYAEFEVNRDAWSLRAECVSEHLTGLAADQERQAL